MRQHQMEKKYGNESLGLWLGLFLVFLTLSSCDKAVNKPLFKVEPLPYAKTALAPHMSAETLQYHYGRHYTGYVKAANRLTQQPRLKGKSFEEVIALTKDRPQDVETFNQVGQAWNHAFFFQSLKPEGGGLPRGRLAEKIDHDFGSFKDFRSAFMATAAKQFGSGWIWLVLDKDQLKVLATANGDTPAAHHMKPLLGVDLWEHAYYLDYRNRRMDYVETVLDNLVNWDFAAGQLKHYLQ